MSARFANAAARAALAGWQLWRSDADDGVVRFFIARFDRVTVLADMAEVERYLERVCA